MKLENKIEGYLFVKSEPINMKELCTFFKCNNEELEEAIRNLEISLSDHGICIIKNNEEISLATSQEFAEIAQRLRTEELSKELSKATLEVLSIILYKKSCTRAEIDYIRGVNSSYILRNLEMRGLISRKIKTGYERIYEYYPTIDTLSYLNVEKIENLPNFDELNSNINKTLEQFYMIEKHKSEFANTDSLEDNEQN